MSRRNQREGKETVEENEEEKKRMGKRREIIWKRISR